MALRSIMAQGDLTWLDACYVQKILRNAEQDESIDVSGITVKAATAKGDNYSSDLHRVTVEFTRVEDGRTIQENKSLIVKAAPQGDVREEMIEALGLFKTELSMMSITLPRMDEILEEVGSTSLGARCFYVQYEKPTHVVIEDLAPKGFRMADRQAGLDLDHCLLAIRNLGKFHVASIALKEKVDFQTSHYGSAANDLLYFFGTSPTDEVRRDHRELMIREYHTSLTSTIAKLECNTEVLSFDNLREILKNRAFGEVVAAMTSLPTVALEKGEELDFNELMKEGAEYNNPGYRGTSYRKIMTRLLPWYDSMGFLDV